ncbi:hypothetical protein [Rufibacter immobilis]|uniref:hypothetical protein n=1 Tax=Rufibacter immobilis TaxID=1348778 RepID=UPI0035E52652
MKIIHFFSSALVVLALTSCSSEQVQEETEKATSTIAQPTTGHPNVAHALKTAGENAQIQPIMTENGLPKNLVCMVNDVYMGKKQFLVEFENRAYYGCCEMCVKTIKSDLRVRVAKDPFSGNEVDKSTAFIALDEGTSNGKVVYFESEQNYKDYLTAQISQ